jgi:hypothetical protein
MVKELDLFLDALSPNSTQTILEGGLSRSVKAFRYTEFKLTKFSSFTRNQRYFARLFQNGTVPLRSSEIQSFSISKNVDLLPR